MPSFLLRENMTPFFHLRVELNLERKHSELGLYPWHLHQLKEELQCGIKDSITIHLNDEL